MSPRRFRKRARRCPRFTEQQQSQEIAARHRRPQRQPTFLSKPARTAGNTIDSSHSSPRRPTREHDQACGSVMLHGSRASVSVFFGERPLFLGTEFSDRLPARKSLLSRVWQPVRNRSADSDWCTSTGSVRRPPRTTLRLLPCHVDTEIDECFDSQLASR